MYVTPYTYHGATSVRLGTHGLRLDPRAAQHPQPAGWAAAHCEHPRARVQQQNPGPKPEARAAAGPRGWRWARSGPGFCKQIFRGFPRVPGCRVAGAGFGFAFTGQNVYQGIFPGVTKLKIWEALGVSLQSAPL